MPTRPRLLQTTSIYRDIMNHIKDAIDASPLLKKLRKQLSHGGGRAEILSLLSTAQQSEVYAITCYHGTYTVKLKSAYALFGIKDALRNYHHPVRVTIHRD